MRLKSAILSAAALITMAVGVGAATAAPAAAAPVPERAPAPAAVTAAGNCANGTLCVWHDVFSGPSCYWSGNFADWNDYNCGNKVSSIRNNGDPRFKNDAVALYYGPNHTGAYACIGSRDTWDLQNDVYRFDHGGFWADGYGQNVNNNIRSHKWIDHC